MNNGLRIAAAGATTFKQGALFVFTGPKMIYDMFDKGARYHWLQYVFILMSLLVTYFGGREALGKGSLGLLLLGLLFAALVGGCVAWLVKILVAACDMAGGPFAWYPGLGFKTSTGAFQPLSIGRKSDNAPLFPPGAGAAKPGEILIRGAAIFDGEAVAKAIKQQAPQLDMSAWIEFGGVPVVPRSEPQHFLIEGRTGSGKTQAINSMLRVVRRRQQPAIITDPGGGFLGRFWREGDLILNPFDARTVAWSPFNDIRDDYDYRRIAVAAIPETDGESEEWRNYARVILATIMQYMHEHGQRSTKQLLHYVMAVPYRELEPLFKGTAAQQFIEKGGEKMLNNARNIASTALSAWTFLPDEGTFSIRDWVRQAESSNGQFLYLTYRDDQMAELRCLIATWLELAIVEGLSLTENDDRRIWFVMDELDSLGKITSLRYGLTKLRKYGGVCVSGLQTIAQLRKTYGRDEAQTLLSCMSTKVIMPAGDPETAQYFEDDLGKQEVERREVSSSTSSRPGELQSASENVSARRYEQNVVLASEIQMLPDLHGFIKPIGMPIGRIVLQHVKMPGVTAPYVGRKAK